MSHHAFITLRRVGGSTMLTVPPAFLEAARLAPGARVQVSIDEAQRLIIERARPRYTLAELLAQCDPQAMACAEDRQWVEGSAVGDELL